MTRKTFIVILWILMLVDLLTFGVRSNYELLSNPLTIMRFNRMLVIPVFVILIGYYAQHKLLFLPRDRIIFFLMLYGVSGFLGTVLYSEHFFYSSFKLFEFFTLILVSSLVLTVPVEQQNETAAKLYFTTIIFMFIVLLTAYFWAIFKPSKAFLITLQGVKLLRGYMPTIGADGVSYWGAIIGIFFLGLSFYKGEYIILVFFGILTILLGHSRTGIISFILSVPVVLWFAKKRKLIFLYLLALILLVSFKKEAMIEYLRRGGTEEEIATLSLRTIVWKEGFENFKESPIFGLGFASGSKFIALRHLGYNITSMHNGYIEILINTGIMGFAFWVTAFIMIWLTLIKLYRRVSQNSLMSKEKYILLGIIGVMTVSTITLGSLSIFALGDHSFCLYLAIILYVKALKKQVSVCNTRKTKRVRI